MSGNQETSSESNNSAAAPHAAEITSDTEEASFYIVSKKKFLLLFITTFGIYGVYWFYRQWKAVKEQEGSNISPIPRAIFSVYFATSLAERIENHLKRNDIAYAWTPGLVVAVFISTTIISSSLSGYS